MGMFGFLLPLILTLSWGLEVQLNGFLSTEGQFYGESLQDPTRTYDTIVSLQPELDVKYNKRSRMHLKPLLRANLSTSQKPEQLYLNVQEAYWEIKTHPLRFKLGQNIYNWGILDGYSTQDIVNGRFLFNPLSTDKRGAPTVDIQYEGEDFQVQALYIPIQARTLLPSTDSRWLPRSIIFNTQGATEEPISFLLPNTFNYYYPGYEELSNALDNNYGFRLTRRWNDWDLAAMYFEGSSTLPQMQLLASGTTVSISPIIIQGSSDVGIIPVYFKQRVYGASGVWAPSDIIFKLETTYSESLTDNPAIAPWSWQNGLGVEVPFNIGSTTLTTILQIYYGKNEDPAENLVSSTGRLFDRAALLAARLAISSEQTILASFLYDYYGESFYTRLAHDMKWGDHVKSEIYVDVIEGDPDTFLGTYTKNDRVGLKISYLW